VKEERLWPLFMKVWNMRVKDFKNITFKYIPREQNGRADELANEAMDQGEQKGFSF
jgi:ribonuclease HI